MMETGLTYTSTVVVSKENVAATMGSGDLNVFATPAMVALMENAAMNAVAGGLPEGSTTVGAMMNTTHIKPSAVGDTVSATAVLKEVEGRKLTFEVRAQDSKGVIGEGTHVRYIVDKEKFMSNKLQAKDLINLGLFTVLYFVIGCCVAIPIGFVPIFLPILGALWSLITGIPFMLFLTRVKKFGMVTIMGILSGLLMGLTGMGFWGVPMGAIFGLLGDLILKSGGYKSAKKSLIGYAVFSLWMVGTYIPMYFMVEDSWASFAASFGKEYADRVMAVMPMWSIILVIAGIFIFAILGGLLGKALLKKHFAKAGIV